MLRLATQIHKWLALVVGLQVLGWVLGGLIMTALPIAKVRSEHHVASFAPAVLPHTGVADWHAAAMAAQVEPVEATLKTTLRGTVWVLKDGAGKSHVLDAATGLPVKPLPAAEARLLAGVQYEGTGRPAPARWYEKAPQEAGREGPVWRVDFDDKEKTSFYLAPETGEVVSRRSQVWRFYDFWWRVHILDFKSGENFNHPLLVTAAAVALVVVLSGFVLLWIRIGRDLKAVRARRS